jgi:hypothetical protein
MDHSGLPVSLSLLLSAARPALAHVGKITLLNIFQRQLSTAASTEAV